MLYQLSKTEEIAIVINCLCYHVNKNCILQEIAKKGISNYSSVRTFSNRCRLILGIFLFLSIVTFLWSDSEYFVADVVVFFARLVSLCGCLCPAWWYDFPRQFPVLQIRWVYFSDVIMTWRRLDVIIKCRRCKRGFHLFQNKPSLMLNCSKERQHPLFGFLKHYALLSSNLNLPLL